MVLPADRGVCSGSDQGGYVGSARGRLGGCRRKGARVSGFEALVDVPGTIGCDARGYCLKGSRCHRIHVRTNASSPRAKSGTNDRGQQEGTVQSGTRCRATPSLRSNVRVAARQALSAGFVSKCSVTLHICLPRWTHGRVQLSITQAPS
jgi:hypothetical protein